VEGEAERFIVAEVPGLSATVWIYFDQTDIRAPTRELRLEEWATKTPEDHYRLVREFVASLPIT
jgi:hypothetical protein